jgi:hypothetical protein
MAKICLATVDYVHELGTVNVTVHDGSKGTYPDTFQATPGALKQGDVITVEIDERGKIVGFKKN